MTELASIIERLSRAPVLLVASDYDGTVAPLVGDPFQAAPLREAMVALRTLAALPQTHVAVVSGRALRDLASLIGNLEDLHLVGSHGSEFDLDFAGSIPAPAVELRHRIARALDVLTGEEGGFQLEHKPASVALHYRNASGGDADRVLQAVMDGPASWVGVHTRHGKKVVELSVVPTNKGEALERIRHRFGASAVVFFGDDLTDEDGFATLTGPDVGVKVGPGPTRAAIRLDGPVDVAGFLAQLCEQRLNWLEGSEAVPIERHSMLSDQRTAALVAPDGRIGWFCAPRIDSPALFAELIGGPSAGYFSVASADGTRPTGQGYAGDSLVLETRWPTFSVVDFLDCSGGRPMQRAGRCDLIRMVSGRGRVRIELAPRVDFGRTPTTLTVRPGGLEIVGAPDPIVLFAPGIEWRVESEGVHQTARADVDLNGQSLVLDLSFGTGSLRKSSSTSEVRRKETREHWEAWSRRISRPTLYGDEVIRSALILKGLCFAPTGAVAAAVTTSLPEHVGGVRNWDYRYCWIRDGALVSSALVKLGSQSEALHFLDWIFGVIDRCDAPERLRPLYTVTGGELGAEAEISELSGYRGSRPVRVGNMAAQQVQLDVFGPVVDLIWLLLQREAPLSSQHWRLVEAMVQAVRQRWREPDHGIWEIRRPRRHHLHSKVMCWVTVDRAARIAERFLDRPRSDWIDLAHQISEDVLENGYKSHLRTFTAAYDGDDLDAAALQVGLSGLVEPTDPRFIGTVEAVERNLLQGPTVYRYRIDDGLPGFEGGFHLCTGWLIEAYVRLGRLQDARDLLDRFISLVGPTGTLSEQYGARTRRALGNVPQAYSHLALIESVLALERV